jgi:segregation and condensation protein B
MEEPTTEVSPEPTPEQAVEPNRTEAESDAPEPVDAETSQPEPADAEAIQPEQVVEALLFASDCPLPPAALAQLVGAGDARDVRKHVEALNTRYEQAGLSFRIELIAKGYQMLSLPAFQPWLTKLSRRTAENRLSPAALETLSVVAYRQPVLRVDVEAIRGVSCGEVLNRLREMGLIKIVGRSQDLGRPMLYGTTKRFLEVFGLSGLDDLPKLEGQLTPPAPQPTESMENTDTHSDADSPSSD